MRWSDNDFRNRVKARAAELNRSVRSLLLEAKVALDIFEKEPSSGRRIDTLEKIADACGWSLAQVMGFSVFDQIEVELLEIAFQVTHRGLRAMPDREAVFVRALAHVYNTLSARKRDGLPIDETVLSTIEGMLSTGWASQKPTER